MHRLARIAVGSIAIVALSACSSGGAGATTITSCATSAAAGTVQAGVGDFAFAPSTVTAKVGDVITWTNAGPASHTVTVDNAPACDTGSIAPGSTGSLTFTAAGTYPFHCSIHASMTGTITITG